MITRRKFLQGVMLAGGFAVLPFGKRGWALAAPEMQDRHLIVVFMRGAVDGLSIVAPYREANYYSARPTVALPAPGQSDGLMDLDGFFGLHPALAPIMPYWQNRSLAFIHASGSPSESRSHFEAQDIMETAMLRSALASQGWLNGLAATLPDNRSPTRALSFGNVLPKIFQGPVNIASVPIGIHAKGAQQANMPQDNRTSAAFSSLYTGNAALSGLYHEGMAAQASVMSDLANGSEIQMEMQNASAGAPPADAFVKECSKAADMIRQDPSVELLFMDVGGWDTHVQQGSSKGQLANKLQHFGQGLAVLAEGLGPVYKNTVILVVSEFGRTVHENGNAGTDHGHGNVAWLMGGGVKGGVWSRWPGLNPNQLHEGRDLQVTTDFRSLVGAVAGQHFGLNATQIAAFVPGIQRDNGLEGIIS